VFDSAAEASVEVVDHASWENQHVAQVSEAATACQVVAVE